MLNSLKFAACVLVVILTLSCKNSPKAAEPVKVSDTDKVSDTIVVNPVNTISDDLASFISGIPGSGSECFSKMDSNKKWIGYSRDIDSIFSTGNSLRINKMKIWADSELVKNNSVKTVFYPFSGPDYLNADIFYPGADTYIMIGMEPIGYLPDVCKMHPDSVFSYLNTVKYTLKDIFKRSYFITHRMNDDLKKTKVNGTVPLISLFIKRTGHQIVSIHRIGVDSSGRVQYRDSINPKISLTPGVRIDFISKPGSKIQSVYYFRTDISDKGLEKTPGFKKYLSELPQSYTYLKAASYLMHDDYFKTIRTVIFDKSVSILQDDSGIAYRYFDKKVWNIRLYGKYSKPLKEFSYIKEPDLEKAYKTSTYKALSYSLGYNWGTDHTSILYAIKK